MALHSSMQLWDHMRTLLPDAGMKQRILSFPMSFLAMYHPQAEGRSAPKGSIGKSRWMPRYPRITNLSSLYCREASLSGIAHTML